ncbi:MAG: IPT/TIG domain-containing protein [Myxococcota bacterium]
MRARVVPLAVVVMVLGACPRLVTVELGGPEEPPPPSSDAGPEPVITEVTVSPRRSVDLDGGAGTLAAYAGDLLTVTGAHWSTSAVQLKVGEEVVPLESVSDTQLTAVVPVGMRSGPLRVVSGERSSRVPGPTLVYLGRGHVPVPTDLGVVDPRITITASGTAGTRCARAPDGVDAGATPYDAECARYKAPQQMALTFSFGAVPQFAGEQYAAIVQAFGGAVGMARLSLSDEIRVVSGLQPYVPDLDNPSLHDVAVMQAARTGNQFAWQVQLGTLLGNASVAVAGENLVPMLLRNGKQYWVGVEDLGNATHRVRPYGGLPGGGYGWLTENGVELAGNLRAAAALEPGWYPYGAHGADPMLVDLSCSESVADAGPGVLLHHVFPPPRSEVENGMGDVVTGAWPVPNPDGGCAPGTRCHDRVQQEGSPVLRSVFPCLSSPICTGFLFCAQNPECQHYTCPPESDCGALVACRGDTQCAQLLANNTPCDEDNRCIAARRCLQGPDGFCDALAQCEADETCRTVRDCAGDPACRGAVGCLFDSSCESNAKCALNPGACELALGCYEQLCRGPAEPSALHPLVPGGLVLAPAAASDPFEQRASPMCVVDGYSGELGGLGLTVSAVTTLPSSRAEDARIMLVPSLGQPLREVWTYSYADGFRRVPTVEQYVELHPDPDLAIVYAVPAQGSRVDMLDPDGELSGSFSVMGTPLHAWPVDATGRMLVVYPQVTLLMDASGTVLKHQLLEAPLSFRAQRADDVTEALWVIQPRGDDAADLARYRLEPDGETLLVEELRVAAEDAGVYPLGFLGNRFVGFDFSPAALVNCVESYALSLVTVSSSGLEVQPIPDSCSVDLVAINPSSGNAYFRYGEGEDTLMRTVDLHTGTMVATGQRPPASMTAVPGGGVVGVFFNLEIGTFELGQVDRNHAYTSLGTAPAFLAPMVVSPDGRRLYIGGEGSVTELELGLDVSQGAQGSISVVSATSLGSTPVAGNVTSLAMDPTGARLVYVDNSAQRVGLVR